MASETTALLSQTDIEIQIMESKTPHSTFPALIERPWYSYPSQQRWRVICIMLQAFTQISIGIMYIWYDITHDCPVFLNALLSLRVAVLEQAFILYLAKGLGYHIYWGVEDGADCQDDKETGDKICSERWYRGREAAEILDATTCPVPFPFSQRWEERTDNLIEKIILMPLGWHMFTQSTVVLYNIMGCIFPLVLRRSESNCHRTNSAVFFFLTNLR